MMTTEDNIRAAARQWHAARDQVEAEKQELIEECRQGAAEGLSLSRLSVLAEVQRQTVRLWLS